MLNESRSPFQQFGPFLPTFLILGITIPAVLFLSIMVMIGWATPVIGAKGLMSFDSSSAPVILYESEGTRAHFASVGGNYENLLTPWRNYFSEKGRSFRVYKTAAELAKLKTGVLVLPSALALSEAERNAVLAFRDKGGSVLATWATGTRNETGGWVGWQFLEKLGATHVAELPNDVDSRQLVLNGESPLSHTHPAGQRLWMGKTSEALLRLKGESSVGRFMNWARVADDARRSEGAVVFSETKETASRAVVFAFSESAWESRPFAAHILIDDTLKWLLHEAIAVRAAWPEGKVAAQVIEMDTEEGFENSLNFASQMQAAKYPATFYVLTSAAKAHPEVLTTLSKNFEIAFHGDVHESFKDANPAAQQKRISTMLTDMATLLPADKNRTGFRAPTEGYDSNTELSLQKFGFKHHAVDPQRSDGRLPVFAKIPEIPPQEDLIVLPRTQRDDINLALHNMTVEQTAKALTDDFDEALGTGALGWLSVHSQNFLSTGNLAKAFPDYLAYVKKNRAKVWVASAGQVAHWWRQREHFRLESVYNGKRLDFNVTVKGENPIQGASVIVMLPQKGLLPHVLGTKVGMEMPTVTLLDDYRALLAFSTLSPGHYSYQTTFAPK
jgi:peptidoglycan/xylan/chitin deacetylase (PgdA/CDA1 family)